jgi:outer membrane receptor protein involved in Fe transport
MRIRIHIHVVIFACLLLFSQLLMAQTTGKIEGKVVDAETGEPLPGVNVLLQGTNRGAATDVNGYFFIINVSPGLYSLRVQMIGYENMVFEDLKVSVNRTSEIFAELKTSVIEGEEVVVQAQKITLKKDQTSSIRNVSSDQIDQLTVEDINSVIDMQAGVVDGHFRGGRNTEVAYLIDGIAVTEAFDGQDRAVDLEPEAIQDLEVITGTFNAEYGNAMSGIVNAVTKDGDKEFHGSVSSSFANYYTAHDDVFIGLQNSAVDRNQDYKLQLSGPIWSDKITFFTNFRYQDNKNHLNGIHRFNVDDYSFFLADDSDNWYSEYNGDSSYVSMDRDINFSFMGKVTMKMFKNFKMSLLYSLNDDEWNDYAHEYKYNPNGHAASYRRSDLFSFNINHLLSSKLFYELKLSYLKNFGGWYVYENQTDPRYVHDAYHNIEGPGFWTGGQDKDHSRRTMTDYSAKFDMTWQMNINHSFKFGIDYTYHHFDRRWSQIRNKYNGTEEEGVFTYDPVAEKITFPNYEPVIFPDSSVYSDIYTVEPIEFSAYIQDKMEFDEMVINFGVRYDYFDPNTVYPSQPRNPANQLDFSETPSKMSQYLDSEPKIQLSPRFGLSYQLGETALLHFSYGHFFQMPPMYAMYQNRSFQISPQDYQTTLGNPEIKSQKTVQYEIGLWQELMRGMGIEVALFYRDIYDLLSAKIISTYNQIEYGLYSNKDYGNAKGLEIKYDLVLGNFSAYTNYTLQYTRGNADNPTQTFNRAGDNRDPITSLIPMSWDQRHTFNLTVGYNTKNWGVNATGYYNSGTPYTWSPLSESILSRVNLLPNNAYKPSGYTVDLSARYDIHLSNNFRLRWTLSVYNFLDHLNEYRVNEQTGRAYTAIIRKTDLLSHRSDFNDYIDRVQDPSMYSAPRMVKLGFGVVF